MCLFFAFTGHQHATPLQPVHFHRPPTRNPTTAGSLPPTTNTQPHYSGLTSTFRHYNHLFAVLGTNYRTYVLHSGCHDILTSIHRSPGTENAARSTQQGIYTTASKTRSRTTTPEENRIRIRKNPVGIVKIRKLSRHTKIHKWVQSKWKWTSEVKVRE
jgi:hypothetical protein